MATEAVPFPMPVLIARGGADDLDAVMEVMSQSFRPCFGEAWTRSQVAGILPMPGVWLGIARTGDIIVGFSLRRAIGGESELLLLAVHRACQRQGIGRVLLEDFIDGSRAVGAERLHLEVRDGNEAVALYSDAGFRVAGRRKGYYRGGDGIHYDALTMVLES